MVITGAGSGMGPALAKRFGAEGARVMARDWTVTCLDVAVTSQR